MKTAKSENQDCLEFAQNLVSSKYAWILTGANEYGGVKWFNAEKMEEILKLGKEVFSLAKSAKKAALLSKMFKKLDKAQENAEYKCEIFLKEFLKSEQSETKKEKSPKAETKKGKKELQKNKKEKK